MNILELKSVTKKYDSTSGGEELSVIDGVSLSIANGDSLSIIGPSGSGKSTLLNIMGTLDRPSSGEVLLEGEPLPYENEVKLSRIRNRKIGFIFQSHHLLPQCTVIENVLLPTLVKGGGKAPADAITRAETLLKRVGLQDRTTHRPGQLSGGERQRVAVVRALINEPVLILADEPTGALDQENAVQLMELLSELNREENVTLVVVTHDRNLASKLNQVMELRQRTLHPLETVS